MEETKVETGYNHIIYLLFIYLFFIHSFISKENMDWSNTAVYIVKPYILVQNAFKLINKIVKCIRTFINRRQKRTDSLWRRSLLQADRISFYEQHALRQRRKNRTTYPPVTLATTSSACQQRGKTNVFWSEYFWSLCQLLWLHQV